MQLNLVVKLQLEWTYLNQWNFWKNSTAKSPLIQWACSIVIYYAKPQYFDHQEGSMMKTVKCMEDKPCEEQLTGLGMFSLGKKEDER